MTKRKKDLIVFFAFNALLFFFQLLVKKIYPPLIPNFKSSLNANSTQLGFLITLSMLGYGLARFPSGILTDILGCKKIIIISGFLMGGSAITVGLAPTYSLLALLTFIMGVSTGLYITASYTFTIKISTDNKEATFTALLEIFGSLAAAVAPLLVVLFIDKLQLGWRSLFYSIGVGIILANLFFLYFSRRSKVGIKDSSNLDCGLFKQEVKETLQIFKDAALTKFIIWATMVGGFGFFAITAFQSFIPSLLIEKGYSFSRANQLFTFIFVIGLAAKPIIGWLADIIGTKRILFLVLGLNLIFYFVFTGDVGKLGIMTSILVFGITFGSHNTLINSYVLRLFPKEYQGTGFGLFSTLYTGIYSLGPVVSGFFTDQFNLVVGMRISAVGILIAAPLLASFDYLLGDKL